MLPLPKKVNNIQFEINELCLHNVYNINLIIPLVHMYNIDSF